jgi:hypothetical protein
MEAGGRDGVCLHAVAANIEELHLRPELADGLRHGKRRVDMSAGAATGEDHSWA